MDRITKFDVDFASGYKSNSQRTRVLSEGWMAQNMYCPCCGHPTLSQFENNRPVADFYCAQCGEQFELKSKQGGIGKKIADGAYDTAIQRVSSNNNPNLFALQYQNLDVIHLTVVPKFFFTPELFEKRKPLPPAARRAGWVGSNILYHQIPAQGKIPVVVSGRFLSEQAVVSAYQKTKALFVREMDQRGWLMDVLQCINEIPEREFQTKDIYQFTDALSQKHPGNHNVQAKIRQKLQVLRDKGYIVFLGHGRYRKVD